MRVIYATSELDGWIDVAKNMQDTARWEPIYWITSPKNDIKIKEAFPGILYQGYIDAVRGVYTHIDQYIFTEVLDEVILKQYAFYEKTALKMMDRMDPTAYSFNTTERTQLYYDLLYYWINMIPALKPDYVLFSESPHALLHYVLYAVCMENDIKVLRFVPTHIEGLTFLSSAIKETPKYLEETYKSHLDKGLGESFVISDRYLDKNRGIYEKALPYYMKDIVGKRNFKDSMDLYISKINRFLKLKTFTSYKKRATYSIGETNISKLDYLSYKLRGIWRKKSMYKVYDELAISANFSQPYIYVALHYQPEKTTSPEGGVFVDQWLMILMLSSMLPQGWKLYVKEHASQFAPKLYGEQGRNSYFYQKVAALQNVSLIKTNICSFDLIDNAQAVATVTGTVGLEAAIRSKYVLCFGYPWYEICEGVIDIKSRKDMQTAIEQIQSGHKVDDKKVNAFLYAVEKVAHPCYLNPGNKVGVSFGEKDNIDNLTACLLQYADKV